MPDMAESSADNRGGFSLKLNAFSRDGAVRVREDARGKFRTDLLDLSPGAASIINKSDGTSIHHHRLLLERRLSTAEAACGEEQKGR